LLDDQRLGRKEPSMMIIGVDYHPDFQQIAFVDTQTGECGEVVQLEEAKAEWEQRHEHRRAALMIPPSRL
jgi:hypothetical protein